MFHSHSYNGRCVQSNKVVYGSAFLFRKINKIQSKHCTSLVVWYKYIKYIKNYYVGSTKPCANGQL